MHRTATSEGQAAQDTTWAQATAQTDLAEITIGQLAQQRCPPRPASLFRWRGRTARLVIVTCGGPFDAATHHYDDNVVAYGSLSRT